jgi:uncharacterized repeat protein (TIGR01451 family)/LPXTG-motif cell wall-anchored protein
VVTNTGNTTVNDIAVVDSVEGEVTCPKTSLAAQESMTCELTGTLSDPGQYANTGSVTGTGSSGEELDASDPSHAFVAVPGIEVDKKTNGVDAATAADAPRLAVGTEVTWTYLVHNTGNVALVGIELTDDREGPITCPETTLAADDGAVGGPDEMTCTQTGVVIAGDYENQATVTGTPAGPDGTPLPGIDPVDDDDISHYTGVTVSLGDVVFLDADDDGVRDTGEPGVSGVTVNLYSDPDGDGVFDTPAGTTQTGTDGTYLFEGLAPGDYVVEVVIPADHRSSTDPATGADPDNDVNSDDNGVGAGVGTVRSEPITLVADGEPTTDGDTDVNSNLTVDFGLFDPNPGMTVEKFTNGCAAATASGDEAPSEPCPGDDGQNNPVVATGATVTWTYVVTNTGNVPLSNVQVTDSDSAVTVTCPATTVAVGASMTCTASGTAVAGQYENTATVTADAETTPGQPPAPVPPVTDISHYFASDPGLTIKKYTNIGDAATAPVDDADVPGGADPAANHVVAADTEVTWRYVVTNTGNATVNDIAVVDSVEGEVTCPKTSLAAQESMTCELSGTLSEPGQYANTGSVTGTGSAGEELNASDPSHAFVAVPGIEVDKKTNGVDAATAADAPRLAVGTEVTWTYLVHNTGNVALVDIALTDDQEGAVTCPATSLAADDGAAGGPDEMTCTLTGVVTAGAYENQATVTGTPAGPDGTPLPGIDPVDDDDVSHYSGEPVVIGDTIWLDRDNDGTQDEDEPGIPGVVLELVDGDGEVIGTTTTDEDGHYQFDDSNTTGLIPDTEYVIRFPIENFGPGGPLEGLDPTISLAAEADVDSDIGEDGTMTVRSPELGEDLTFDGGFVFGAADLAIDKTLSGVETGQATFELKVRNNGPSPVRGPVAVVDQLPAELSPLSATGDGWTCELGSTITCENPSNLGVDEELPTITVVTKADQEKLAQLEDKTVVNTATVSGENVNDTNPDNNTDTAEISTDQLVLASQETQPPQASPNTGSISSPPRELAATDSPSLAKTGAQIATWLLLGASLVLGGSGLVAVTKRRKKALTGQDG